MTPSWERVKQLFQEALDRPPEERAAWLRAQCGEDRDLLADVEIALLAACQKELPWHLQIS